MKNQVLIIDHSTQRICETDLIKGDINETVVCLDAFSKNTMKPICLPTTIPSLSDSTGIHPATTSQKVNSKTILFQGTLCFYNAIVAIIV